MFKMVLLFVGKSRLTSLPDNNVPYWIDDKGTRSLTQLSFAKRKFALPLGEVTSAGGERAARWKVGARPKGRCSSTVRIVRQWSCPSSVIFLRT